MSNSSNWKPNWRNVWIWSAAASALLAALLTCSIFSNPNADAASGRPGWQRYTAVWAMFWAMLTVTGVVLVFRMTVSPGDEFAERQRLREAESRNSAAARATERALRWIAGFRRKG